MSDDGSNEQILAVLEAEVQAREEELASLGRRVRVVAAEATAAADPAQFVQSVPKVTPWIAGLIAMVGLLLGIFAGVCGLIGFGHPG
jgi:hypothetical protein